ncbi:hypothetical protein [Aneurinibacillus danicus]|uniref:hypothetical protein n=1 Tax=Aneurinibacillus danicus TaxID=267746 RepID=UPI0011BE27B7|nr:hypothetical protein [Aneurinibacillus danicus]
MKDKKNRPATSQTDMSNAARLTCIMGEEKPEEELMGKRKSSPRLSATRGSRVTVIILDVSCS